MADMRLIVAGAGGRMGRTLIKAIADSKELTLAGAVEGAGSAVLGRDSGERRRRRVRPGQRGKGKGRGPALSSTRRHGQGYAGLASHRAGRTSDQVEIGPERRARSRSAQGLARAQGLTRSGRTRSTGARIARPAEVCSAIERNP